MGARYVIVNEAKNAVVTMSPSAATGYPPENLLTDERTQRARSTGVASQQFKFAFPAAIRNNMVSLIGHNFTSAATIMVDRYTTSSFGGTNTNDAAATKFSFTGLDTRINFASREMMIRRNMTYYLSTLKTDTQSVIITVYDPNNPAGFLEAGVAVIGEYNEFTRNFLQGAEGTTPDDMSSSERATDAVMVVNPGDKVDKLPLNLDLISEASDLAAFQYALDYWGKGTRAFFLSKYPAAGNNFELYGQNLWRITQASPIQRASREYDKSQLIMETA